MSEPPTERHDDRWVVAIGGNALADPHDPGDLARQQEKASALAGPLVEVIASGIRLAIVHGNGPQVGARLLQGEAARGEIPAQPLHICVAETQAEIGHYLSSAIDAEAGRQSITAKVVSVVTHMLVDGQAPEFDHPDKPVGPAYEEAEAKRLASERGWQVAETVPGTWRRVVPSPKPLSVIEQDAIDLLLRERFCVIAAGGGGIPLARVGGSTGPVEAVVDKDYAAERIATAIGASRLIILTDVEGAALSFSEAGQRFLSEMTAREARKYLARGEFAPGSMGPKVEACVEFVEAGGDVAIIAATGDATAAFTGQAGTRVIGRHLAG